MLCAFFPQIQLDGGVMSWIAANIGQLMMVSGILTFTMVYAAIAPNEALRSNFGESLSGPVASVVVRNWGALIALIGVMLIYGANRPPVRPPVLSVAGGGGGACCPSALF